MAAPCIEACAGEVAVPGTTCLLMYLMTGAKLGLSLTLNVEQYEDLAGLDDEAGIVVCTVISPFFSTVQLYVWLVGV